MYGIARGGFIDCRSPFGDFGYEKLETGSVDSVPRHRREFAHELGVFANSAAATSRLFDRLLQKRDGWLATMYKCCVVREYEHG